MPRLYLDAPLSSGLEFDLPEACARHVQVLRLQPGDALTLFNGQGGEYAASVLAMGKRHVSVQVGAFDASERESPLQLTLVQALSATERMDYTVQKATELGVQTIQIVQSAYCGYKLAAERAEKRLQHWQAVAESAAEQCGRTRVPRILAPIKLEHWLAQAPAAELKLLLSPIDGQRLNALPAQAASVQMLVGPEGGFSLEEEASAKAAGFQALLLGPRIFRTETVAPVVAALLQARYGDF
ncbi:16S rRNA (uracil(1498)-N(3))-methyltransferase [Chitinimonas taiwanensis]|uniref:Ribosomal RNA small subunit methyltransferase E n=1 Tax=Chitinimonas taiwanensis DSM 18899 TaxID=1121279 RepID=A0A1K2HP45_9NEIS|nr:16S rRNA (uracil(1498)-N(3))-methyltransferase [Chitinimonas taiwanensis]SFZ78345.1 16S rRNA (uracil1498-N3)-methyltransferase [Chitinimonas taiwanensis DSM 18899]